VLTDADYILPGLTRALYLDLLPPSGEPYSEAQARVSLLLDIDRSRTPGSAILSQRRYAEVWRWTHKQVRIRWQTIWQDATRLATSNGRQMDGQTAAKLPPEWLAWMRLDVLGETPPVSNSEDDQPENGPDGVKNAGAHEGHREGHTKGTERGTENGSDDPENADQGHTKGTERGTPGAHEGHTSIHPTSRIPHPASSNTDERAALGDREALDDRFEEWWEGYPKKRGKKVARTAYLRACRGSPGLPALLLADVERRRTLDDRWRAGYVPDPATYLNQERWTDELSDSRPSARAAHAAAGIDPGEAYRVIRDSVRGAATH